jgi:hypothetical protein
MGLLQAIFGAKPPFGAPPFAPPHPNTGGAEAPTTPETMNRPRGLSGFIDRLAYPTNGLGQVGLALLAGGGGGLGNAAQILMAQGYQRQKARMPNIEHVGDSIGVVDPTTGKFTPTYTAPQKPEGPHYWESNDGSLHAIDASGKVSELYHDPTPKMNFIPDGMGGGSWVAVPSLPSGTAPTQPIGPITPIDDPAPANTPPAGGTGAAKGILRRNNPGALRIPGSLGFQSFATPQAGIAAQEGLLGRYMNKGLNSVSSIVERYAPRQSRGGDNTDEQVNNYIGYVARRLGVNPNDTIAPALLPHLAEAIREFETGRRAY